MLAIVYSEFCGWSNFELTLVLCAPFQFLIAGAAFGSRVLYERERLCTRIVPLADSEPSRMVTSWLAATSLNVSVAPSGQRTSMSAVFSAPRPKCRRGSFAET